MMAEKSKKRRIHSVRKEFEQEDIDENVREQNDLEKSPGLSRDRRDLTPSGSQSIDRLTDMMALFLEAQVRGQQEAITRPTIVAKGETVPIFDPDEKNQTIEQWCVKIDELREMFHWSEDLTIYFAISKLKGLATIWYQGLSSVKYSWEEWKIKLQQAFPSQRDYNEMLWAMMTRKKKTDESYGQYFYEKQALLNGCKIQGRDAVSCIIGGISESHIKAAARAGDYDNPESLFCYLRSLNERDFITPKTHCHGGALVRKNREILNEIRCYKCGKRGHKTTQCRAANEAIKKCTYCQKFGHKELYCFKKKQEHPDKGGPSTTQTVA